MKGNIGKYSLSTLHKIIQNTGGDVKGPTSSTNDAIVRFHETTGKVIQNSGCTIDDSDNMTVVGNVGIGTTNPTEKLDVDGDAIRIRTAQTPASAAATGTAGMICWDASYIYICTATDTWKRASLASW